MKRDLKKIGCGVLAVSIMLSALGGCAGGETASGGSSSADSAGAPKKLSGSISVSGWNDAADALTAVAKAFMQDNPGTTVNVQKVDSNYTKLYSELAADSGVPDVVTLQNRDLQSFKNKYPDAWMDLTDLVKPEESNFDPFVLPMAKVEEKYYAVPWDIGPCALYYRKDIFEKAGVDATSIKTYDAYLEAGKKIVQATGGKTKLFGFDYSGSSSDDMVMMLLNQLGGQYYDKDGKVKLDSPEMIQVMNLLKKMKDAGVTVNLPNEWNDRITATENEGLASIPYAVWYAGTLQNSNTSQKGKWGIVPLPAFTDGGKTQANMGGSVLAVSAKTENADLAKAFVKYALMSSKGNQINMEVGKLFSSYKPAYNDEEYKKTNDYFGVSVGQTFAKLTDKIPDVNFGPYFTDVNNALKKATGDIFVKNMDPAKALADATQTAQKAVDNE